MPKLIMSVDGAVMREVMLTKERTSLGRRPYNDIVIDNLAVSGEHAVVLMSGADVYLEDLNSTNGSYVNGQSIRKHRLQHGDQIVIGKYAIQFDQDHVDEKGLVNGVDQARANNGYDPAPPIQSPACLQVITGVAAGREIQLHKSVTSLGQPGIVVATITREADAYTLSLLEGGPSPRVNGVPIERQSVALQAGDLIEMAGSKIRFVQP